MHQTTPQFDEAFRSAFRDLVAWRRDVRRFQPAPVSRGLVASLIELAALSPSVGFSQPWRFVLVESAGCREAVRQSFLRANAAALAAYGEEQRERYARLKLEGLGVAPVQIAVFSDETAPTGSGLGQATMPETRRYSVVGAIQTLWLAARSHGLGLGWVSILEPEVVTEALSVPAGWKFVAYLCLGWPLEEHLDPELERHRWEQRLPDAELIVVR